jgi:signal transduction histidine kinase/methyl-accepting chemotaxis protein
MKLRYKIILGFFLTFFLIFAGVLISIGFYEAGALKKEAQVYLSSSSRARAEHIRTFIREQEKSAAILAAASVYLDFLRESPTSNQYKIIKEKIDKRFIRTKEADPRIYEVFILDSKGKIIASSDKNQEGLDKSQDDLFLKAQNNLFFKDIYFSESINKINYTISVPIKESDDRLLGVSVLRFLPDFLYEITKNENGLGDTEENFLINQDKYFITPSRFLGESVILKNKNDTENARECYDSAEVEYVKKNGYSGLLDFDRNHVLEAVDYRNVEVIDTHAYIPETNWCLITKVDKADVYSFQRRLIFIFFVALLIALFSFFSVSLFVIRKITKPIEMLKFLAEKIKQGDFNFRTNIKSKDEIGELSKAFDTMTSVIEDSKESLEKKVAERTKELELKTEQMSKQKVAIMNILEDVEKEKEKTEEITRRLNLATKSAKIGVWEWDVLENKLIWDDQMYALYGVKKSDFSGAYDAWINGLHPDDKEKGNEDIKKALSGEKDFDPVFRVVWPSGEIRYIQAYAIVERDDLKKPKKMIGINFDITNEKEIDKAKTEFVSLASHQLRTPLSAINWYSEMLLAGDAGKLSEEQERYLKEIYTGNQRMVALVNALLNVSRLDLGTFIVEPTLIDLPEMIKSVLTELKSFIAERKLTVEENYAKNLPKFNADHNLLRIIFQNLLSNSVKYTSENGKVAVSVNVTKKGEKFGEKIMEIDALTVSVSDSGIGVPLNQKDKIFSKLFRADNAKESEAEGTGLGLYLVKSIIDKTGGEIWFDSEEGKGSVFYVFLPLTGMKRKEGSRKLD